MCIHSKQDLENSRKSGSHAPGTQWGVLWWEHRDGEVRGVDCLDVRNPGHVKTTVGKLINWHPELKGRGWTLHMEHVNRQREALGLEAIEDHYDDVRDVIFRPLSDEAVEA